MRRADHLSQPDDRGVTQRGDGRHLQPLEGIETFLSRVRALAEGVQIVGKQHRRCLADPKDARLSRGVFKGNNEHALARLRGREPGTRNQEPEQEKELEQELEPEPHRYFCSSGTCTAMMQLVSPTPWQA